MDARSLIALWATALLGCAGPDPSVRDVRATPSPQPGATRVSLELVNDGGKGSVELHIVLRGDAGSEIHAERTLEVAPHQRVHYETDIETPPGTYSVSAAAEYPD